MLEHPVLWKTLPCNVLSSAARPILVAKYKRGLALVFMSQFVHFMRSAHTRRSESVVLVQHHWFTIKDVAQLSLRSVQERHGEVVLRIEAETCTFCRWLLAGGFAASLQHRVPTSTLRDGLAAAGLLHEDTNLPLWVSLTLPCEANRFAIRSSSLGLRQCHVAYLQIISICQVAIEMLECHVGLCRLRRPQAEMNCMPTVCTSASRAKMT
mmetsp:Transcript_38846/g.106988  ORF Transcript_38846/g.106988 Transcript_38846/m.106988 type:complete len:210 (+) Transcript_38846:449-1078(+)